ncbi:MAG: hypothetical protein CMF76_09355, partial [Maricaulis sp.]|nr:hypothetical protein [Maricaulis sp.]
MNASTPTAEAFRLFDPQLIALLIELADNGQGEAALPWTQMGERLERDPSNVTRSTRRMADTGLISLSPLRISDKARSILAAWNGEARPAAPAGGGEQAIPHNLIHASPLNPRKTFDAAELDELADSIAEKGLLQN